ncbi:hypothetical protein [Acinetobacter boissieri]|uniref:Uncharacterized protein n=1 Tax=Acinetobacter boissieri TaxID=1219383 RepID=A0A1G6GRN1_9GAMM|nr:hypothetical protein [Acinetobacter boissieri]SDB84503.1 hypothetical protein SAMN05421733_10265 [Acinetobacter boissieri]
MAHFGFTPSEELLQQTQQFISKKNNVDLHELRNNIALAINQEIIDTLVTQVIVNFPESEKKETAAKLAKFIQSSVAVLLKQLLGKSNTNSLQQLITFSKQSLFKMDQDYKVGHELPKEIVINLKQHFADLKLGNKVNLQVLIADYKLFADEVIRHFMHKFYQTLDLGMIKRKTADIGCITTTKAIHVAIDKIIPQLNKNELKALAMQHDTLFFTH